MSASDRKNLTKDPRDVGLFDANWQRLEQLRKMRSLRFVQAIASLGN